jgi:hypothetical protein
MWIPEVIFCLAAGCWVAQAGPHDTKDLCLAYLVEEMVPTILSTDLTSNVYLQNLRCAPPPGEPA